MGHDAAPRPRAGGRDLLAGPSVRRRRRRPGRPGAAPTRRPRRNRAAPCTAACMTRADEFPIGAAATLAELEADPHPLLARLREHEPVSWLPPLGGWLVTRRDLAMQVMRDPAAFTVDDPRFSTGQVVGPSMLTLDGEEHTRHRAPFAGPFRLAAVRDRFTEPVAEETDRLLDGLEPAGEGEL